MFEALTKMSAQLPVQPSAHGKRQTVRAGLSIAAPIPFFVAAFSFAVVAFLVQSPWQMIVRRAFVGAENLCAKGFAITSRTTVT